MHSNPPQNVTTVGQLVDTPLATAIHATRGVVSTTFRYKSRSISIQLEHAMMDVLLVENLESIRQRRHLVLNSEVGNIIDIALGIIASMSRMVQ